VDLRTIISKILLMKPEELYSRVRRELRIIQERLNLLPVYRPPQESSQMTIHGLLGFEQDSAGIKGYFRSNFPNEVGKLIQKARRILTHRFDVLGYEGLDFAEDIDWCYEPVRNKKAPIVYWSKILSMGSERVGDLKIIWELNRHQHLIPLGQAYFLTGEPQFAEEVIRQISDWQEKNPPHMGPNWASSLEVAFRLISWIWAIKLIKGSDICNRAFLGKLMTSVGEHASHIERFLSTYSSPNTHLTGEALGLFYAGVFFPHLPGASRWRKTGADILFRMLPIHLLTDGGYVERTLWYHQYTVGFYLHFFTLLKSLGEDIPSWAWKRLENGATFLMYSLKPDGTIPMVGDDDGGFFLPLSTYPVNDPRGLLAIAASLFERGDFKALSGGVRPEVLWLLGMNGEAAYQKLEEKLPEETSKGFNETGYFFLRSGWGQTSNYMLFDCGPHGWMSSGHAHADLLSIQVASGRNGIVEDPGTYVYLNEDGWRDYFRGLRSHATFSVDGKPLAIPSESFQWEKIPSHRLHQFYTSSHHDYVAGSMYSNGVGELVREIHFIKPHYFLIMDKVKGKGRKVLDVRFPLSIGKWILSSNGCYPQETENGYGIVLLESSGACASLEPSWISRIYGKKEASTTLVLSGTVTAPSRTAYLVDLSGKGRSEKPSFVMKGDVFELSIGLESWVGFGVAGSKEPICEEEIETDCKAGLMTCSPAGKTEVLAVYEGSYLYFQGKEVHVGHNVKS